MRELLPYIKAHFDNLQDRFITFRNQEVQVEGWLKGELLLLLSQMRDSNNIEDLDREVKHGRSKLDLKIHLTGGIHYVELKHWLIGVQRGFRLDPHFYFGDPSPVGITKDYDKLDSITSPCQKWFLILCTPNPGNDLWEKGLDRFHEKFFPRALDACSNPYDYPPSYFLGLLSLQGKSK